jgi:hypothetical protein
MISYIHRVINESLLSPRILGRKIGKVYIKMYGNLMAEDYKFFQGYVYVPINRNELNKENRIRIILNNKVPWYIIIDNTLYELINEVKINLSINNNFNGDHNY